MAKAEAPAAADAAAGRGLLPPMALAPTADELARVATAKRVTIIHGGEPGEVWTISTNWLRSGLGLDPVSMVDGAVRGGAMSLLWTDAEEAVLLSADVFPSASGAFEDFAPRSFYDSREQRTRFIQRTFGNA